MLRLIRVSSEVAQHQISLVAKTTLQPRLVGVCRGAIRFNVTGIKGEQMQETVKPDQPGEVVFAVILRRVDRTATIEMTVPSLDKGHMYSFRLMAKHAMDTMVTELSR